MQFSLPLGSFLSSVHFEQKGKEGFDDIIFTRLLLLLLRKKADVDLEIPHLGLRRTKTHSEFREMLNFTPDVG
jgi:hypothetical protein